MRAWMANGSREAGWVIKAGWGWWIWGINYRTRYRKGELEDHGCLRLSLGWWVFAWLIPDRWLFRFSDVRILFYFE